jgi:hypothetical protein
MKNTDTCESRDSMIVPCRVLSTLERESLVEGGGGGFTTSRDASHTSTKHYVWEVLLIVVVPTVAVNGPIYAW